VSVSLFPFQARETKLGRNCPTEEVAKPSSLVAVKHKHVSRIGVDGFMHTSVPQVTLQWMEEKLRLSGCIQQLVSIPTLLLYTEVYLPPTNATFQVYLSFVITKNSSGSLTVDGWSKKSSIHAFASRCCASGCSSSAGPKLEDQSTC
jgi:hypothetical protein